MGLFAEFLRTEANQCRAASAKKSSAAAPMSWKQCRLGISRMATRFPA